MCSARSRRRARWLKEEWRTPLLGPSEMLWMMRIQVMAGSMEGEGQSTYDSWRQQHVPPSRVLCRAVILCTFSRQRQ